MVVLQVMVNMVHMQDKMDKEYMDKNMQVDMLVSMVPDIKEKTKLKNSGWITKLRLFM